jgi:acetolactate synthase-1/2/3 large subunit
MSTTHSADQDVLAGAGEAADALVAILAANGVSELFTMPGDAFPVLESIARAHERRRPAPRIATCLHEIVAVAAAHGHHMVSRVPQACLLHVDVGLQMAGGMLHNAQRAHAGVVLLGGRTPATWDGSLPGGRVIDMHWMQDRRDLGGTVRDYVKWSHDLQRTESLPHVIQRACRIAAAEPSGPVYVSLLREMLMEPMPVVDLPDPGDHAVPRPSVPELAALEEVADLLNAADRPLAIAGTVGRDPAGFAALGELADRAALPVYTRGARANLSSEHPMHLGTDPAGALADADVVLLLDVDVPWIPLMHRLAPGARVVQLDADPIKADLGQWGFPVHVSLQGSTAAALPVLAGLVAERRTSAGSARADARREAIGAQHRAHREGLLAAARSREDERPIAVAHLAQCVAEMVEDDTIVVDDSTTAIATTSAYIPTRVPGSYFLPIGSSMGWGAGAALGAKLAAPDHTVINLNAEGNFLSGAPEAALWGAARLDAPYLTVVADNAQYAAIKLGVGFAYPDGALLRAGTALDLDRPPDLVRIAESCGAHAERVTEPGDLRTALRRGLDAVRGGQPALVDVSVERL